MVTVALGISIAALVMAGWAWWRFDRLGKAMDRLRIANDTLKSVLDRFNDA